MRKLTNPAKFAIATAYGAEPMLILSIDWKPWAFPIQPPLLYGDKEVPGNVLPKILEISPISQQMNLDGSGSTGTLTVTLDDTDGSLKDRFNTSDIHKVPVKIYQYFEGLDFKDKFTVFEGQIATPIIWSESKRTLTFDLLTIIQDVEVGFAAEQGQFTNMPPSAIGKVWPMVFGTPALVPGLTFNTIPSVAILDAYGFVDPTLDAKINSLLAQHPAPGSGGGGGTNVTNYIIDDPGQVAYEAEMCRSGDIELAHIARIKAQDGIPLGDQTACLESVSNAAFDNSSASTNTLAQIAILQKIFDEQTGKARNLGKTIPAHSDGVSYNRFPISGSSSLRKGEGHRARAGDYLFEVSFDGFNLTIKKDLIPRYTWMGNGVYRRTDQDGKISYSTSISPIGFVLFQPGTVFTLDEDSPFEYVINTNTTDDVFTVWAYKTVNQIRTLVPVPKTYWTLGIQGVQNALSPYPKTAINAMTVTMKRALTIRANEHWESDDIWVDMRSRVGPNVTSIIAFLVREYSQLEVDIDSFAATFPLVNAYPCNFALSSRPGLFQLIKDLAYQSRCALWIANGKVYIKYLPHEEDPVAEITEFDILDQTIEVSCTPTEEIVTKFTSNFYNNYVQPGPNIYTARHNVYKYGSIEQNVDYFSLTDADLVTKSTMFWLIRKSESYKIIKFRTPLHLLILEAFDTISLNFKTDYLANLTDGSIKAIVQNVSYNSDTHDLDITCWVPIVLGKMEQHPFAWPELISTTLTFPYIPTIYDSSSHQVLQLEAPWNNMNVTLGGTPADPTNPNINIKNSDFKPGSALPVVGAGVYGTAQTHPSDLYNWGIQDPQKRAELKLNVPPYPPYDYSDAASKSKALPQSDAQVFPGTVLSGKGKVYRVEILVTAESALEITAVQIQIDSKEVIPAGTACFVVLTAGTYFMQVPVWL